MDLDLHIVDHVQRFSLKGDRLAHEGLDKDLHTATETENKVQSRLLLDIVIRKGAAVLELLASKDKTVLIRILHDDKRITPLKHQTLLTLPCLGSWL